MTCTIRNVRLVDGFTVAADVDVDEATARLIEEDLAGFRATLAEEFAIQYEAAMDDYRRLTAAWLINGGDL